MKRIVMIFTAISLLSANLCAQTSEALKVKTFTLDNGLTVWLNEDPNQTAVYGAVVVKAGAVDCPGTGIAHYFEHMMFKGTDKIGTIDYAAEKPYLDSISVMYDSLALAKDEPAKAAIQKEINRLSIKAADYAIPNEFNNLISEMGGSGLNAFTSYDETVYHNKFLPQYFEQWAELNSERIMNPVFRLFQSELETVYEEKNRSDDNLVSDFRNSMLRSIYKGTGYSEEILGTTENLKNPRLAQMREFFDKYYVASNMGLILTGNIREADVMPVIEKTFGRIRKGEAIERAADIPEPIEGVQDVTAMINMPIVKLGAICFRGPSKTDPDFLPVSFLMSLLNNDASTGLLDKMMVDHKLMMAMALPDLSFRKAGSIMVLYMPKLIFQKEKKATRLILDAIETIKKGDFSDEYFASCKKSFKKGLISETENLSSRMQDMAFAFSDGLDWNEILKRPERIDAMTKEDLLAIANKYFGDDYILIHKKKGIAVKDKLQKPDYEKVLPRNREACSAYAQAIRKSAENISVAPKAVDFQNDAEMKAITPLMKLYASKNPYNDVFSLRFEFCVGTYEMPELERVTSYVNLLGTQKESFDEISARLQTMGSSVGMSCTDNSFYVNVNGFDANMDETLAITADLLKNIKGDRKKLRSIRSDERTGRIMSRSDMESLSDALREKVMYGEKSSYLVDKGKFKSGYLLEKFAEVQKYECYVSYSGTLSAEEVSSMIASHFDTAAVSIASSSPVSLAPAKYDTPTVFFVNKKDASQSQIYNIVTSDPAGNQEDRYLTNLFSRYLGGGMSSLLFQEIREFRSMAYSTSAYFDKPYYNSRATVPTVLVSYVGTQSDKTIDAMKIVDSLVFCTPMLDGKLDVVKKELVNSICNQYPDFRALPGYIITDIRSGYTQDPVNMFSEVIPQADTTALKEIWKKYVAGKNAVWTIVGNSKKVDMEGLKQFGTVTTYKPKDIIK